MRLKLALVLTLLLGLARMLPAQQVVNGNRVFVSGTGLNIQCANDVVTGTTINLLAKFTSTGCILIGTGDTNVPVYVVTSASATSGNASLAMSGQVSCVMDATLASTEGFYVIASVTTAGRCHPQSGQPNGVFVVGVMAANSTTSGTAAAVNLVSSFNPAGAPCVVTNGSLQYVSGSAFACATPFTFSGSTITAAAAGLIDLSAITSANGARIAPNIASAAPTLNGSIAYETGGGTWRVARLGGTSMLPTITGTTSPAANTLAQFGSTNAIIPTDLYERFYIPAANCSNTTAGTAWSIGSGGTVTCRAGTNNQGGFVSITDTAATFAQFNVTLPLDMDLGTNPFIRFYIASTDTTTGHTIIPQIKVSCGKGDGTTTDDVTFNAAHSSSTTTLNTTANQFWSNSNVQLNGTDMTGCVGGSLMTIQVGRAADTATNAEFYGVDITFPRLMVAQAN